MSDEQQTQEPAATTGNADVLQRSIEALERKNQELIAELRAAKKSKAPDGVNVDELLEFKRNYYDSCIWYRFCPYGRCDPCCWQCRYLYSSTRCKDW